MAACFYARFNDAILHDIMYPQAQITKHIKIFLVSWSYVCTQVWHDFYVSKIPISQINPHHKDAFLTWKQHITRLPRQKITLLL